MQQERRNEWTIEKRKLDFLTCKRFMRYRDRSIPKDDRKALWSRPQARSLMRLQAGNVQLAKNDEVKNFANGESGSEEATSGNLLLTDVPRNCFCKPKQRSCKALFFINEKQRSRSDLAFLWKSQSSSGDASVHEGEPAGDGSFAASPELLDSLRRCFRCLLD